MRPSRCANALTRAARILRGDRAQALTALHHARRTAPQLTRYSAEVHDIVHYLAEHDRRASDTLADFTRWLGIIR